MASDLSNYITGQVLNVDGGMLTEIKIIQKLPKIGLPIVLLSIVILIFVSKSSINIGYGEQEFYLKLLVGVLLLMMLHWEKDFML